jgi:hypothetical protein
MQIKFIICQAFSNGNPESNKRFLIRREVKQQEYAALDIQQAWWDVVAYWARQRSAQLIQNRWRCALAKNKVSQLVLQRDSACAIQRIWRGYYQLLTFVITIQSVIAIQKVGRGMLARKDLPIRSCRSAATAIQSAWRGFSIQVQYQLDILDIIAIQSLARRKIVKREIALCSRSVAALQGAFRCAIAQRVYWTKVQERVTEYRLNLAAIMLQVKLSQTVLWNIFCYISSLFLFLIVRDQKVVFSS